MITAHEHALACAAYARRHIQAPLYYHAPRVIELTTADREQATQVRAEALAPEDLSAYPDVVPERRQVVAAEQQARMAHAREARHATTSLADVAAVMRGGDWLRIMDIEARLDAAGLHMPYSTVKHRLQAACGLGQVERRGTNSHNTMYRAVEETA